MLPACNYMFQYSMILCVVNEYVVDSNYNELPWNG